MARRTRLGFIGSWAAYLGFVAKLSEAPAGPSQYDILLVGHGAVGHWKFHDGQAVNGSFPLTDAIGGLNGLAPSGAGITPQVAGTLYDGDTAAQLSGSATTFYTVPDGAALHLTGAMTLDCWFKIPTGTSGTTQALISAIGPATNLLAQRFNGAQIQVTLNVGGANVAFNYNGVTPALDAWHYAAVTYNGTIITIYFEGQPVATQAASGALNLGTSGLNIGASASGASRHIGYLDESAIYNRALSASEVALQYEVGLAGVAAAYTDDFLSATAEDLYLTADRDELYLEAV